MQEEKKATGMICAHYDGIHPEKGFSVQKRGPECQNQSCREKKKRRS